jgi:Flp pilus assembly protein TadG
VADERRRNRGSVLLMVPAGFLVLMILAAITFDFAHLYLAQRQLADVAEAAANDAAAFGVDQQALRDGRGVRLRADLVEEAVRRAIAAHRSEVDVVRWDVQPVSPIAVRVTLDANVGYVFAKAVPGGPSSAVVHAAATASAVQP